MPIPQIKLMEHLQPTLARRCRRARMDAFLKLVKPPKGARIVDLGGLGSFGTSSIILLL
jgi:hypothetical protein